jgi:DNA-directed RNA polymerase specialized sigma24 family protein
MRRRQLYVDATVLDAAYCEAWYQLHEKLAHGATIENMVGWLVVATRSRAVDDARTQARPTELPLAGTLADGAEDPSIIVERRVEFLRRLELALGRMTAREREAFELCRVVGVSRADAGRLLGVTP